MGQRGTKPKGRVRCNWSANFSYAIGLLASDGCVSKDNVHIDFTSKDKDQVENFIKAIGLKNVTIGLKSSQSDSPKKYYRVQFGDVIFVNFLRDLGITSNKSKTIGRLKIPDKYFSDFLRGIFDGDGYSYSYWDKRWKSSFMFYIGFVSASFIFISWLREELERSIGVRGHLQKIQKKDQRNFYYQLKFAKKESIVVLKYMYEKNNSIFLKRKYLKTKNTLAIVDELL